MTNELRDRIAELVAHAWALGMMAGNPNTPARRADEMHREVEDQLDDLLDELDEAP